MENKTKIIDPNKIHVQLSCLKIDLIILYQKGIRWIGDNYLPNYMQSKRMVINIFQNEWICSRN